MDDLISRQALLNELADDCPQIPNDKVDIHAIGMYHQYQHDTYKIVNAPSVDAVEVVRCRDCKYASMTSGGECKYCKQWETEEALYLDGNFFCAWGERR